MAWVESHQEIARHPKTKRLARQLSISVPTTIGHLHLLWHWCLDFADDGDLAGFTAEDIADGAMWEGEPERFYSALVECGWLDADPEGDPDNCEIHDWDDYTGRLQQARESNRERQRRYRERHKPDGNGDASFKESDSNGMSDGRNGYVTVSNAATVPNLTVPNQTKPTIPDQPEPGADAPPTPDVLETAAVLHDQGWFIEDTAPAIQLAVARSFRLVPQFMARDGPFEAEKFCRFFGQPKKRPSDWYRSWLNWIKRAARDRPVTDDPQPSGKERFQQQYGHLVNAHISTD